MTSALRLLVRLLPLVVIALPSTVRAQGVLIAPTSIFVDSRVRTASLMLVNPNAEPVEIEIGTLFGYPVTDSAGRMSLRTVAEPDSTMPSAVDWIRAFPRRVTIGPNAQQTVRLLMTPPPGIPDGEYWARLMVAARGGQLPLSEAPDSASLQVGLSVEVRTILPVLYRKGRVRTGVAISDLRADADGDSVVVRGRLEPQGNAALLATVRGELVDSTGVARAGFSMPVSVYYPLDPRFTIPTDTLAPGRYLLRFEVAPTREDLAPESVLPFEAVQDSVVVELP